MYSVHILDYINYVYSVTVYIVHHIDMRFKTLKHNQHETLCKLINFRRGEVCSVGRSGRNFRGDFRSIVSIVLVTAEKYHANNGENISEHQQ